MKKFKLHNFFIYLNGLLIFEFLSVYPNRTLAKDLYKNNFKDINSNSISLNPERFNEESQFSNSINFSKYEVIKDIISNGEKIFNLLAFEQEELGEEYSVDIESDVQFRENGIFNAQGNATMYISNAILKGDLIKYDLNNKLLTVVGNVVFKKGEQYFEASKLFYDLKTDTGYINDVYGLLDSKSFTKDFKLEINREGRNSIDENYNEISDPKFTSKANIGLVNTFEDNKSFNITKANIQIPSISRWRYQTDKLTYNSQSIEAKKIFFTNDIYNEPQFIFLSKNFSAEIIKNKLRLVSRNSWLILDNKVKIPIGRRSVFDKDPLTKWGIGADFQDKDGYFLFRSTYPRKLFKDYSLQIQPYFLLQRSIEGKTNSYRAKNTSIFSDNVRDDITFTDNFALDIFLRGKEKKWNIDSKIQLNSLNSERLSESLRSNLTISRRINLNKTKDNINNYENDKELGDLLYFDENENENENISFFNEDIEIKNLDNNSQENEQIYTNFLDLKFYNVFREKVVNDFSNDEIYFASGFNLFNTKEWSLKDKKSKLSLGYDIGQFKAKSFSANQFENLFRNSFIAKYNYEFPIWRKENLDSNINESYRFSPVVINQSLNWSSGLQTGMLLYSDGSSQFAAKFNTGPVLKIGGFKKKFFDYTYFSADFSYVIKDGSSPFSFDNINSDPKINFNFEQQIYGPLQLSYQNSLNLKSGDFTKAYYALDFKRRAYAIGAFYNTKDESLGIRFNIFNFDYSGLSSKFRN